MFGDVGWGEILLLALVGLFIFGPDRLPKVASDAAKQIRALRQMARDATRDLRAEMDPGLQEEFASLAELHPRRFMSSLMDDDAPGGVPAPRPAPVLQYGESPPYDVDAT